MWIIPMGDRMVDPLPSLVTQLAWLPKEDLDVYAAEFERAGLRGGLNRHRNLDRDSGDMAALRGQPLRVPALFHRRGKRTAPRPGAAAPPPDFPTKCRLSKQPPSPTTAAAESTSRDRPNR